MEVNVEVAKEAVYWRGLIINRYSAVEFAIAELVTRASLHPAYSHFGQPPFGPTKKLKRLIQMIELAGPIASYRTDLRPRLAEFEQYEEHRHFMAHAIMVPKSGEDIAFMMYDHREGVHSVGTLQFEMKHLETVAKLLSPISIEFTDLVVKICQEIPLPAISELASAASPAS